MVFLDEFKILQGISILAFVLVTVFVAIRIGLKYFKNREVEYILIGLTWVGLASPWFPDAICFVANFFFPGIPYWYLNEIFYLVVGMGFLPLYAVLWLIALRKLVYHKKGTHMILINIIIGIIFMVSFFSLLFVDKSHIASIDPIDVYGTDLGIIMLLYIPYIITLFFITGLHFTYLTFKSKNPENKLRAKFLFVALISYTIGALLESVISALLPGVIIITFIAKVILITASIEFYISFILPDWVKNVFL